MATDEQKGEVFEHVVRTLNNLALDLGTLQHRFATESDPDWKRAWFKGARDTSTVYMVEETAFLQFASEQGVDGRAFLEKQPNGEVLRLAGELARSMTFTAEELAAGAFAEVPTVEERLKKMRWWLKEG